MRKIYPNAVLLRKTMVAVAIGAVAFIVLLVFINIYRSSHQKPKTQNTSKAQVSTTANSNVPSWYQNSKVRKADIKPAVSANPTSEQGSQTAQNTAPSDNVDNPADDAALAKAMSASINTNQITADLPQQTSIANPPMPLTPPSTQDTNTNSDDQNRQSEKKAFLKTADADSDYLSESLKNPTSAFEIKAGTIIPAVLITGLNSDLPGQLTAQVRSNVYDTVAGKYILIPQGAKLTGLYDSQIVYGQERVLVVWRRVIYPNGQSINLEGMPGVDMTGYAGFNDQVNNHYLKIFGSVLFMSVISAGAQLSQPQQQFNNNGQMSVGQTLAASLGANIMNTATAITQKNLAIQPTLVIRPGYLFNVSVTKDMVFPGAYDAGTTL